MRKQFGIEITSKDSYKEKMVWLSNIIKISPLST